LTVRDEPGLRERTLDGIDPSVCPKLRAAGKDAIITSKARANLRILWHVSI
jgi:hypothetical protein